VLRHQNVNKFLLKKYFLSKGILTFILSPINLFSDLISKANSHHFKLSSMPKSHQDEINEIIRLFDKNKIQIKKQFHKEKNSKRTMIFYRWYGNQLNKSIPALIKTLNILKQ
jgi:beta-hydroxylase